MERTTKTDKSHKQTDIRRRITNRQSGKTNRLKKTDIQRQKETDRQTDTEKNREAVTK